MLHYENKTLLTLNPKGFLVTITQWISLSPKKILRLLCIYRPLLIEKPSDVEKKRLKLKTTCYSHFILYIQNTSRSQGYKPNIQYNRFRWKTVKQCVCSILEVLQQSQVTDQGLWIFCVAETFLIVP